MPQPAPPPELNIPPSKHTVDVSIIDTTGFVGNIPVGGFMLPEIPGYEKIEACCYAFLIKHSNPDAPSKYDHLLFDLGIRKDWQEKGPRGTAERLVKSGFTVKVEKNVIDILRDNGDDPNKIGGIIWSHWHWDHTGDPSTFPSSTDLIVGPGFKDRFVPNYPTIEDGVVAEDAWKDRTLREIDFDGEGKGLKLGQYKAFDFFGDGSFYLVDSPGHATGHICGLARTSADPPEFMILGGDIAHHGGEFRPTKWLPIPEDVQPNPTVAPYTKNAPVCPGSLFEAIHPNKNGSEPFCQPIGAIHDNKEDAVKSLANFQEFDAQDNIFAMIAHDLTLYDIVDLYPKPANGWRSKGWKEQGRWRFLAGYDTSEASSK